MHVKIAMVVLATWSSFSGAAQAVGMTDFWNGAAHFEPDQMPAPVAIWGLPGQREVWPVARADLSPTTIWLYSRCYDDGTSGQTVNQLDICLFKSVDSGKTYSAGANPRVISPTAVPHTAFVGPVSPSILKVGSTWLMVWEEIGSALGAYWAQSSDGALWTNMGPLFPGSSVYRATPSLYQFQGVLYVFYAQKLTDGMLRIIFSSGPILSSAQQTMAGLVQWGGGFLALGGQNWDAASVSSPKLFFADNAHWMVYEGASLNLGCGGGSDNENVYGWGIAQSFNLSSWTEATQNPVVQADGFESCGASVPTPFVDTSSGPQYQVFYSSMDARMVVRDHLSFGSMCDAFSTYPNYREKNHQCMKSCGQMGGTLCYHTKDCSTGRKIGMSYDCTSCCK